MNILSFFCFSIRSSSLGVTLPTSQSLPFNFESSLSVLFKPCSQKTVMSSLCTNRYYMRHCTSFCIWHQHIIYGEQNKTQNEVRKKKSVKPLHKWLKCERLIEDTKTVIIPIIQDPNTHKDMKYIKNQSQTPRENYEQYSQTIALILYWL